MSVGYSRGRKERRKASKRTLQLQIAQYRGIAVQAMGFMQRGFFGRLKYAFFRR